MPRNLERNRLHLAALGNVKGVLCNMPQGRIKAKPQDVKNGDYLYIRLQNEWKQVQICGTKPSTKGVKVEYLMEDGTTGAQLLSAFYRQIPDNALNLADE